MTMLLKAQDTAAQRKVRAFAATNKAGADLQRSHARTASVSVEAKPHPAPVARVASAADDESPQTKLLDQIAALQERLEQDRLDAAQEIAAAFVRGRDEGEQLAHSLEQQKLDSLSASIKHAHNLLAEQAQSLQTLSLQLAQLAMSRILGDQDRYAELVADSIMHRANQLSDQLIISVRVSPEDFADAQALAALSSNTQRTDIMLDPALNSGACMFDLKLGSLDAGLPLQWGQLIQLMDKLADEAAAQ